MRPWLPLLALVLAVPAPSPASAAGVDLPVVQEAVGGPCVDLTRVEAGEYLRVVTPPPCGPQARVVVTYCGDRIVVRVEVTGLRPFEYHVMKEENVVEHVVDLEDEDECD